MNKKKNKSHPAQHKSGEQESKDRKLTIAAIVIVLLTFITYFNSLRNGFVTLDDDHYVLNNPLIHQFNLKELFTTYWMGNYHPLVMLAYTFIYSIAHETPFAYHAVNLGLHLFNTVLVLFLIFELTGVFEIACIVSVLFGIHPMHVESVAWVSELKDLMYTVFFLASLFCYVKYVKQGLKRKYFFLSLLFFLFSVLSKGMGVSLSIVLLLIDFYLGRKKEIKLLVEKIPFFILSIAFGLLAIHVQKVELAVQQFGLYDLQQRIVFACYGFIIYLVKLIIPFGLSAYYPYPIQPGEAMPVLYFLFPVMVIVLVGVVFYSVKKSKTFFFAFAFYAATIFLVLQLIPVGGAVIADRYTYIPSIGFFLIVAFTIFNFYKITTYKTVTMVIFSVMLLSYTILSYQRIQVWNNGMSLLNDVLNKGEVPIAYYNRGLLFEAEGQTEKAIADYTHAIKLFPQYADAYNNRGLMLTFLSKNNEAMIDYNNAIQLSPDNSIAYYNRGNIYYATGDNEKAIIDFNKAIKIDPGFAKAWCNRANIYFVKEEYDSAIADYSMAIQLDNTLANAFANRASVFSKLNRIEEACSDFSSAAKLGDANSEAMIKKLCQ